MADQQQIDQFLLSPTIGVVGASSRREKFGNKVLRCYQMNNYAAIPVHPSEAQIEGVECVASVAELPDGVESISVITPPMITEQVVQQAASRGIKNIWMQPGAQNDEAIRLAAECQLNLIADGTCVLIVLGYDDH